VQQNFLNESKESRPSQTLAMFKASADPETNKGRRGRQLNRGHSVFGAEFKKGVRPMWGSFSMRFDIEFWRSSFRIFHNKKRKKNGKDEQNDRQGNLHWNERQCGCTEYVHSM
jgi:hypothetical protein